MTAMLLEREWVQPPVGGEAERPEMEPLSARERMLSAQLKPSVKQREKSAQRSRGNFGESTPAAPEKDTNLDDPVRRRSGPKSSSPRLRLLLRV